MPRNPYTSRDLGVLGEQPTEMIVPLNLHLPLESAGERFLGAC